MFALEEPFTSALSLVYSRLTPSNCVVWSHSNAILTSTSTATAISFLECQEINEKLKFVMVNVCVIHGGDEDGEGGGMVRSNFTELQMEGLEIEKSEVKIVKMELIKSPYSDCEYLFCLKILRKDEGEHFLSATFTFSYNIDDVFDGEEVSLNCCDLINERACRVQWLPPFSREEGSRFAVVGESQLKFIQLEGACEGEEVVTYDLFPTVSKVVDSAFFSIHKPFFRNVLVVLEGNGGLLFGIPAVSKQSPDYSNYRTFYSCYHHFEDEQDSFHILQREITHVRQQAEYTGIRIIDLEPILPGLSIMALISSTPSGNLAEYRVELYFLSITQNAFKMTPIAQVTKRTLKSLGEFIFECQGGERMYFKLGREVWMMDLKGLIRLYLSHEGTPNDQEIRTSIKVERVTTLPNLPIRFFVASQGHLFMLNLIQGKPELRIHEIGPFPPGKREGDIALMMLRLKQLLANNQSIKDQEQEDLDYLPPLKSLQEEQMTQYLQQVQDFTKNMKKTMSDGLQEIFRLREESKKLSQAFMLKIAPKMEKLTAIRQRFHQNRVTLDDLCKETLQEIESSLKEDGEGSQSVLMEQLRLISDSKIELSGMERSTFSMTARVQRQRLKQVNQILSQTTANLNRLFRLEDKYPHYYDD